MRSEIDRERKILDDLYQQLANTPLEGQDEADNQTVRVVDEQKTSTSKAA